MGTERPTADGRVGIVWCVCVLGHSSEISHQLSTASNFFSRWKQIYESGQIHDNHDFDWTQGELLNTLRNVEWDLEDLDESIRTAPLPCGGSIVRACVCASIPCELTPLRGGWSGLG